MIGLIFLALLLLILLWPVTLCLEQKEQFDAQLKWLCFRFSLTGTTKPKQEKRRKKKAEKKPTPADEPPKKAGFSFPTFTLQQIAPLIQEVYSLLAHCLPPIRRLLRRTTIGQLWIDILVAEKNAAETALGVGRYSALVHSLLALCSSIFTVRIKRIAISPDWDGEQTNLCLSAHIHFIPFAGLIALCNLLIVALPRVLALAKAVKKEDKSNGKTASTQ